MNGFNPRVQLDWRRPPQEFFFAPGVDAGLWTTAPLPQMWERRPKGRIAAASVSDYDKFRTATRDYVTSTFRDRIFRSGLLMRTVPVVLENVTTEGHFLAIDGKHILNGAAGTRLRNKYSWANEGHFDADAETAAHFAELRAADPVPPVWEGSIDGLDFVIDTRNAFNFYHFATETLGQLCLVDRDDFTGRVLIHSDRAEVKTFIRDWIDQIFPRLRGRVEFLSGNHSYDRCLSVLNARHLWFQTGASAIDGLEEEAPETPHWLGRVPDRKSMLVLDMNSCDDTLLLLRETALSRIEGGDWSHLPRRFWVGRKSQRHRPMKGEAALTRALAKRGFEIVYFEDYSPLEQVALLAQAEIMMSYHGAGFANMLFASPETHCIEIGTHQTCRFRWRDFLPHTIASGCRYTSLFADFNVDDPAEGPPIRSRPLQAVRLGPDGQRKVLAYVDAILGQVRIDDPDWLAEVARMLARTGDTDALARLLDGHPNQTMADPDMMVQRANLHLAAGDPIAARLLLERAWEMTGNRPFLLERLVLLCERLGVEAPWAKLHAARYPQRAGLLEQKLQRQRRQA
ncbi:glycosyltransferase family 61 protein [Jannaschia rubra]|uniref:glycosyltransferase family 61 protein n=1 Tax=Jannaschia rubra TaxID=282197 RepID=UPI0024910DDE|nr:glycosyltransferase family 61 protein [Jannaschia rubra]